MSSDKKNNLIYKAVPAGFRFFSLIAPAAALIFATAPVICAENADYVFLMKDGSTIIGSAGADVDIEKSPGAIKVKTAFGELSIPKDQIVKYFKQPPKEAVKAPEKKGEETSGKTAGPAEKTITQEAPASAPAEIERENKPGGEVEKALEDAKKSSKQPGAKPEEIKTPEPPQAKEEKQAAVVAPAAATEEVKTVKDAPAGKVKTDEDELLTIKDDLAGEKKNPKDAKPKANADNLLNLDDDKLIDMLGESKVPAPQPVPEKEGVKGAELGAIKEKYQSKKSDGKGLVPKNLSPIEEDVKKIASSSTEEDILLGGTKEVKVKLGDTKPVELIKAGGGTKGTAEVAIGTGEIQLGTKEVKLGTSEVIIDETAEVQNLGGDELSEKIVKEFKKHKGRRNKDVSEGKHLDSEINKYFKDGPGMKPAVEETKEVKVKKEKGKKNKK